ncbi:hypothetical protein [Pseudomonas huanghezhanensis]|uniref:hypothetical protein n=1 Tax=Pseudomonas huanghezhanensis TaxID=3002903 RepID=UPI002286B74A|nr:hypothetical protein [Pseudomonas sp. BSw22131]
MSAAWPDELARLEQLIAHYKMYGLPADHEDGMGFIQSRCEALRLMHEAYRNALADIQRIRDSGN